MAFAFLIPLLLAAAHSAHAEVTRTIYSFTGGTDGSEPCAGLALDEQGNLYGTTYYGGVFGYGTVFKLTPAETETVLYSFTGGADGANPCAAVVLDDQGNVYGTTSYGGVANGGTVFELSPAGTETVLHSFTGFPRDGNYPLAAVVLDREGNIYGTTDSGGAIGTGTAFKLAPDGTETILHSFRDDGFDGAEPGEVVLGNGGHLYGATVYGGTYGIGVVYSLAPDGTETILHEFTGGADGEIPDGRLLFGKGGLYGTAGFGGAFGAGTVFKIARSGTLTVLYSFAGAPDGEYPVGNLVLGSKGHIYGVTAWGGVNNYGTVFKLNRSIKETVVHRFKPKKNPIDGLSPRAGLVRGGHGTFYGTTVLGGSFNAGTVFEITPR